MSTTKEVQPINPTHVNVMEYLHHLDVVQLLETATLVNTLLKKKWKSTEGYNDARADVKIESYTQKEMSDEKGISKEDTTDVNKNPKKDDWISWTERSSDISFASSKNGIGDGEEKVACELGTRVLGQNSPYDIECIYNDTLRRFDVKKLDTYDDFNTGKDGRNALRPLKVTHTTLLDAIVKCSKSMLFTQEEHVYLANICDVSPDELSVGTLKKMIEVCEILHNKEKTLRSSLPTIPVTTKDFTKEIPIDHYYSLCIQLDIPFPERYKEYIEKIQILQLMNNAYIKNSSQFMSDLNTLVNKLFTDITPIIVDRKKGYIIINDLTQIKFLRITRGNPRFKVLL